MKFVLGSDGIIPLINLTDSNIIPAGDITLWAKSLRHIHARERQAKKYF